MSDWLKSCPFCGSNNVNLFGDNRCIFVICQGCSAEVHFRRLEDDYLSGLKETRDSHERKVREAWNTRRM